MSILTEKSPKHCGNNKYRVELVEKKTYKKLVFAGLTLLTIILCLILLVWVILHPTKPEFSLKQADIFQLNYQSEANLINSSVQLTLSSKNPNQRVGIYYDELHVYASYNAQPITRFTSVAPFYQGHVESNLVSVSLAGTGLPVAPSFGYEVGRDQTVGRLSLGVRVNGRIRWRVGSWVSGRFRLTVNCVAVMGFGPNLPSGPVSTTKATHCSTSV